MSEGKMEGARSVRPGAGAPKTDLATGLWQQLRDIQRSGPPGRYWEMMQAIKQDPELYVAWGFDSTPLFEHFVVHFKDGSRLIVRNDLSRRE